MGTLPFHVLFGKSPSQNTDNPLNSGEPHTYRLKYVVTVAFVFISYYIMSKCINFNWVHCYACIMLPMYSCIKMQKFHRKGTA